MNNDLVLEQYLSPVSPKLAGFRLDAFSAIKPRVTHSPSSKARIWDASATLLEDRLISPAILYIQVSALQVLNQLHYFQVSLGVALYYVTVLYSATYMVMQYLILTAFFIFLFFSF